MDKDWIDDIIDDEPATWWQLEKIERLCETSSTGSNYICSSTGAYKYDPNTLTYEEASAIIYDLKENDNPRDCRDQFLLVLRRNGGTI